MMKRPTSEADIMASADLSDRIRALVADAKQSAPVAVSALMYATAAVIGEAVSTLDEAEAVITMQASVMYEQIQQFGVRKRHP